MYVSYLTETITQCSSYGAGGVTYKECASACRGHCRDMEIGDNACEEECVPGCQCPLPQYLDDNGQCVHEDECTCYDKYGPDGDKVREAGETVERNCEEWYGFWLYFRGIDSRSGEATVIIAFLQFWKRVQLLKEK